MNESQDTEAKLRTNLEGGQEREANMKIDLEESWSRKPI